MKYQMLSFLFRCSAIAILSTGVCAVENVHAETKFSLKPYLLVGQVKGDLTTEQEESDFNLGWGNAFQKGNGALGVDFDIRPGRIGILSQVWYSTVSDTESRVSGIVTDAVKQDFTSTFITETVGVSLFKGEKAFFDLIAGGRFASVQSDLVIRAQGAETEFSQSETWVDPVVGFNTLIPAGESLTFTFHGDYGGFDTASKSTWQAAGAANFSLNKAASFALGYRAMMHDYESGDFRYAITTHGPTLGFLFAF